MSSSTYRSSSRGYSTSNPRLTRRALLPGRCRAAGWNHCVGFHAALPDLQELLKLILKSRAEESEAPRLSSPKAISNKGSQFFCFLPFSGSTLASKSSARISACNTAMADLEPKTEIFISSRIPFCTIFGSCSGTVFDRLFFAGFSFGQFR